MYQWLIIMNNGNRYIIENNIDDVKNFLDKLFSAGNTVWNLRDNVSGCNAIVINAKHISEILCSGE